MAVGIYRTVEGVFAKVFEVIGQQVFGVGIDVVGKIGQILMVDATRQHALASVLVVDGAVGELNLVRHDFQRVVAHLVPAVGTGHMDIAVDDQLSCQVDGVERTNEAYGTVGMTLNLVEETGGERACKIEVSTACFNAQINAVTLGRYVAVDECFCVFSVVANSVNINLF